MHADTVEGTLRPVRHAGMHTLTDPISNGPAMSNRPAMKGVT